MEERPGSDIDNTAKPFGWPEGSPLPTMEEAEEAVQRGERAIVQMLDDLKGKLEGPTSEMLHTLITI